MYEKRDSRKGCLCMVREGGVEPPRPEWALEPESSESQSVRRTRRQNCLQKHWYLVFLHSYYNKYFYWFQVPFCFGMAFFLLVDLTVDRKWYLILQLLINILHLHYNRTHSLCITIHVSYGYLHSYCTRICALVCRCVRRYAAFSRFCAFCNQCFPEFLT